MNECDIFWLDRFPDNSRPLLLLHGLGSDSSSWIYQIEELGNSGLRPIAVDLPGFGKSKPLIHQRWTIRRVADEIVNTFRNRGIYKMDVAGISLGGAVALQIGLDHADFVDHLILINTFARLRPDHWNDQCYLLRRFFVAMIKGVSSQANLVAWRLFPREDQTQLRTILVQQILNSDPAAYRWAMFELGLFDKRQSLSKIRMPVLVISGQDDTTVSLELQKELAKGIRASRHVIIPNAGHAVIVDQPAEVSNHILAFVLDKA